MLTLAAQADNLLRALDESTKAISVQLDGGDERSLENLERALDRLLVGYRQMILDIKPSPGSAVDLNYEPFIRCVVSFATIVQLVGPKVGESVGIDWGLHVFSDQDFELIGFDQIKTRLPEAAIRRILPDQVSDLKSAVTQVARKPMIRPDLLKARIFDQLDSICAALMCPPAMHESLDMTLLTAQDAMKQLRILDPTELATLIEERKIISVPTWTGERQFPSYQFGRTGIVESVRDVCENAAESFKDWPLAIWMARNWQRPENYFATTLGNIGLWKPSWNQPLTGEFSGLQNPDKVDIVGPVYRVARNVLSPFYFSGASVSNPQEGGRFDLDKDEAKGSLYTALAVIGAWAETFEREPVLTLRDVLVRRVWTLTPKRPITVADLEPLSAKLAATNNRADTQDVAITLEAAGEVGIRVSLRSRGGEIGVVFFGPFGPNLPSSAEMGIWSSSPGDGIESDDLWTYIVDREKYHADFPVVLRRFPTEMNLTSGPRAA